MPSTAKSWKHMQQSHQNLSANVTLKTWKKLNWECRRYNLLPSLNPTSLFTIVSLICLEIILLSTVSDCAKTFYMHWNTSNSIFRIDNTDHIIDVNKGNLAFEFDQVHIICPVYEPGTYENETEKYIIYNVSKVEYETCRITNADPRVIAICDKPQKLMFFTITFRPFTPQPGGLEFLPGNDYYFISTSSKDDLYRRIGGRCSTNNMKVVFKVCCAPEEKNKTAITNTSRASGVLNGVGEKAGDSVVETSNIDINNPTLHNVNNVNNIGINAVNSGLPIGTVSDNGIRGNNKPYNGASGTSINTNLNQFNRIPIQTQNGINMPSNTLGGDIGQGNVNIGSGGIMLTPAHSGINLIPTGGNIGGGIIHYPGQYPGLTGIRINNVPPHHPSYKNNFNNNPNSNDDHYDKHPNEVVKNEELTYNSAAASSFLQINRVNFLNKLSHRYFKSITSYFDFIMAATYLKTNYSWIIVEPTITEINKLRTQTKLCRFYKSMALRLNFTFKFLISNPIVLLLLVIVSLRYYFFQKSTLKLNSNSGEVQHRNFTKRKKYSCHLKLADCQLTKLSKIINEQEQEEVEKEDISLTEVNSCFRKLHKS